MNSKEKIKNIKSVINEFYHKEKCEGRLTECANDCWKSYQKVCDEIEQDLDRLEKLEKENKELKGKYNELQLDYNDLQKDYDMQEEDYDQLFAKFLKSEKENQELKEKVDELEQAISFLKDSFKFKACKYNTTNILSKYGLEHDVNYKTYRLTIDKKEFDLLKKCLKV